MPTCRIEVLTPDFRAPNPPCAGCSTPAQTSSTTRPKPYRSSIGRRSGGRYERTLDLLDRSRRYRSNIATKTGIIVGLGEEHDEIVRVFDDLRRVGVSILTIGHYLRPSAQHAGLERY